MGDINDATKKDAIMDFLVAADSLIQSYEEDDLDGWEVELLKAEMKRVVDAAPEYSL